MHLDTLSGLMFDDLERAFPVIEEGVLTEEDAAFFRTLPLDYRAWLATHNGGFVQRLRYGFPTGVPWKTASGVHPSGDDCPHEFFGIPSANTVSRDDAPGDLLQKIVDHEAEEFLPGGIIAFGRTESDSLLCISLREDDFGEIYYWDYYWRYPWCKKFFEARIAAVELRFPGFKTIVEDPEHPRFQELKDALNEATLVRLADSFTQWCATCIEHRAEDMGPP